VATEGQPVYNKAQYPRISLSCIFNDFLGDFGSGARGESERGRAGETVYRGSNVKLESLKRTRHIYIYILIFKITFIFSVDIYKIITTK